jgi:hypothetical protein
MIMFLDSFWLMMKVRLVEGTTVMRQRAVLLFVGLLVWQVVLTTSVWAQAAIPIQAMSDWLNTIAWYGLVPALRIGGVMLLIFGFANLGGSVRGSTGFGLAMMIAGGLALLAPEIANAIYSRTTVGTDWATNPTS